MKERIKNRSQTPKTRLKEPDPKKLFLIKSTNFVSKGNIESNQSFPKLNQSYNSSIIKK